MEGGIALKVNISTYFACLCLIVLTIGAMSLQMNFSNSNFSRDDLIYMLSRAGWFYLILLPVGVLLIRKMDRRLSVLTPFTLATALLVIFELVQYPSIFCWDTFRHSATTKYVIYNGVFSNEAGYYGYPGTFFISAFLSEILGLPVLISNIFFAYLLNMMIFLLLFLIGKVLAKTKKAETEMSWLIPTIYLAFSFRIYNNNHYSPQLLGLCLYIFFIYACFKTLFIKNRGWKIIILILIATLTLAHSFSTLFTLATLLFIHIMEQIKKLKLNMKLFVTTTVLIVSVIIFFGWHMFFAPELLTKFARLLPSVLRGEKMLSVFVNTFRKPAIESLMPLLSIYRYGIYGVFTIVSMLASILHWREAEVKILFFMGVSVIFGGIAVYFTPGTFDIERALFYGGVIISILSSYVIANTSLNEIRIKGVKIFKPRRVSEMLKAILPFVVVGTFLVSRLYFSTYLYFIHPDEMSMAKFVENVKGQITVEVETSLVVNYYTNVSIPIVYIDKRSDNATTTKIKIEKANLNLQYLPRQLAYFNLTFIENMSNLIYSNGLGRIYAKPWTQKIN